MNVRSLRQRMQIWSFGSPLLLRRTNGGRQFWKVPRWSLEGSPVVAALLVAHTA
jgi:hypothetical protein